MTEVLGMSVDLVTERLHVRPFRMGDVDDALAYLSDPEVMRFVEPPFDRAAAERFVVEAGIQRALVHAVEEHESGRVIGHLIWHPWTSDDSWEIGWLLRRDRWQQGLATELTRAVLDRARSDRYVSCVVAETVSENVASIRCLERLGFMRRPDLDDDLPVWTLDLGVAWPAGFGAAS